MLTSRTRILLAAAALGLASAAQAQVAVRDAATGQLRAPTAAEMQQLQTLRAAQSRNLDRGLLTGRLNPQPVRLRDGSDMLESTERMMNFSVARVLADGRVVRQCVADAEMAQRLVAGEITGFAKNPLEALQ
jgi:chromosome condensin MukBEF complex kleisin-like MukF subunit